MTSTARLRLALPLALLLAAEAAPLARAADTAAPTSAVLSLVGDAVATTAAESAVRRALPGAPTLRVSIRDPWLFALQECLFTDTADSKAMRDGRIGTGTVAGLGFYVDDGTMPVRLETGERSQGFIAPYVADSKTDVVAWNALSAETRVMALDNVISRVVGAAASNLLAR